MKKYETVIGLEVHLQLFTKTKAFCGCRNEFGIEPNSATCPVCLGFPGSLPVLNEQYLDYGIKVALSLKCNIAQNMKFDRKNYFYPDLPKGYQISQFDMPLAENGYLEILGQDNSIKKIRIKRVHMEEDAGKLIHQETKTSCVDYNRCGTPLLEIVTEPDISSPDEAHAYLTALKDLLKYLDVSDCDMEKGSLRCDANISIRPKGAQKLGTKAELKNMNSFKGVRAALEYEQQRQIDLVEDGEKIKQETRLWNLDKKVTESMRTKEEAHDYRYFPEPDLPLYKVDSTMVKKISTIMPELPAQKKQRFIKKYSISEYDAGILVSDKIMADYFEDCVKLYNEPKVITNWIGTEILKYINSHQLQFFQLELSPKSLVEMLKMIEEGKINNKIAKDILVEMIKTKKPALDIVKEKGLTQISDEGALIEAVKEAIKQNPKPVEDYKSGKQAAAAFLMGQVMKMTKGKANPAIVNKILKKELEDKK